MEDEIKKVYSRATVNLVEVDGGVFEVSVNREAIYSKLRNIGTTEDRFPHPNEIVELIKQKLA